ncbi:MAG TPA: response regulator, partial [Anaerolineales bacterium]|nr:response regulator [Anaerolineales bacterium]
MSTQSVEILLVEDNPSDLELALAALNDHRLANRIQIVRDGVEALDYVFCGGAYADRRIEDTPRVILLDLKLPKVTGLEVLQKLKTDPRTRRIPVVVLTSSREDSDMAASYELGVNSYIVKPVDFQQFSDAMRALGLYWVLLNQYP